MVYKIPKDYDFKLLYYLGKENFMADVLSRKIVHVSHMMIREFELVQKFRDMKL